MSALLAALAQTRRSIPLAVNYIYPGHGRTAIRHYRDELWQRFLTFFQSPERVGAALLSEPDRFGTYVVVGKKSNGSALVS